MLNEEISISEAKEQYYFINNSYYDISNKESKIKNLINGKYKNKRIYKLINISNSITFIGDSITEGIKNNFHPWYEPLIYCFNNKKIINISKGSYRTSLSFLNIEIQNFLENGRLIIKNYKYHILKSKSDLYIIAIGTNDVRYRDSEICAMTKEEYIENIKNIVKFAKFNNKNSILYLFLLGYLCPMIIFQN